MRRHNQQGGTLIIKVKESGTWGGSTPLLQVDRLARASRAQSFALLLVHPFEKQGFRSASFRLIGSPSCSMLELAGSLLSIDLLLTTLAASLFES